MIGKDGKSVRRERANGTGSPWSGHPDCLEIKDRHAEQLALKQRFARQGPGGIEKFGLADC